MKMIKKDGWQFWVEIYDDYVIKTPKKKEEIAVSVKKYPNGLDNTSISIIGIENGKVRRHRINCIKHLKI